MHDANPQTPLSDNPRTPPTVTVVVPTKNAARTLGRCLDSLRQQTYPCTTVVVDNNSSDDTIHIAHLGADILLFAGPERSAQRNVGARACPADVVGFIDSDMIVEPSVVAEAVAAITQGAASVVVPERTIGSGFWVTVRAFERSFYEGSEMIEAARFFSWQVFTQVGGFDESLTGPEDWDLAAASRLLGPSARTLAAIEHDEGTLSYLHACRKKGYYGPGLASYVSKHGPSALHQIVSRPWMTQPLKLLSARGLGMIALKLGEATAVAFSLIKLTFRAHLSASPLPIWLKVRPTSQPAELPATPSSKAASQANSNPTSTS